MLGGVLGGLFGGGLIALIGLVLLISTGRAKEELPQADGRTGRMAATASPGLRRAGRVSTDSGVASRRPRCRTRSVVPASRPTRPGPLPARPAGSASRPPRSARPARSAGSASRRGRLRPSHSRPGRHRRRPIRRPDDPDRPGWGDPPDVDRQRQRDRPARPHRPAGRHPVGEPRRRPLRRLAGGRAAAVPWLDCRPGRRQPRRPHDARALGAACVLAGHTDTVPANGNAQARIEGDTLWGLGSTDMKAGLAVMLELARTVAEPAVDVTYVFYAGEEVAAVHNGLGHLFRDRPDLLAGDVALLGEPTDGSDRGRLPGHDAGSRSPWPGAGRTPPGRGWVATPSIGLGDVLARSSLHYEPRRPVLDGCEYREALQAVDVTGRGGRQRRARSGHRSRSTTGSPPIARRTRREAVVRALLGPGARPTATRSSWSTWPTPPRRRSTIPCWPRSSSGNDLPVAGQARLDRRRPLRRPRRPGRQLRTR